MSSRRTAVLVSREYDRSPDSCARAVELLLKNPVKKAEGRLPSPDGRDAIKGSNDDRANRSIP